MTFTIHAAYDAGTELVEGFYRSDVHSSIPTPNLEITPAEYSQALLDQEAGKVLKVTGGALLSEVVSVSLADYRERAKRKVDAHAGGLVTAVLPMGDGQGFLLMARVHEAAAASGDGSRTQGKYPLLAAKVLAEGASVSHASLGVAATDTDSELATIRAALAAAEEVRLKAAIDIDAAIDAAAIDAVIAALVWPS